MNANIIQRIKTNNYDEFKSILLEHNCIIENIYN